MSGNESPSLTKAQIEEFEKKFGLQKKDQFTRQVKAEQLKRHYNDELYSHLEKFYSKLVEDNNELNEELFIEYNQEWKIKANNANRLQKVFVVDPFAFHNQIEIFKKEAAKRSYPSLKLDNEALKK